jgi:2-polyprenyl-3-methyl-5-hydroxy-6-metoxy-1,4-benzoquinol methylase
MFEPHLVGWTPETIGRLWDYYAQHLPKDHYFSRHSGQYILRFVKRYISVSDKRVLDYGCGPGFMLEHLLAEGVRCSGLEFSQKSARETERLNKYPQFEGVRLTQELPSSLAANSFDIVLCIEVIEHLLKEQVQPMCAEIHRILKDNGYVIVTTPHSEYLLDNTNLCPECGCIFHKWQHISSWKPAGLRQLMESHGFRTVMCQPTLFRPHKPVLDILRTMYYHLRRVPKPAPHLIYIGRKT